MWGILVQTPHHAHSLLRKVDVENFATSLPWYFDLVSDFSNLSDNLIQSLSLEAKF